MLVLLVQTPKRSFPQNWHGFYLHERVSFTYYKVTQPESYAKKTSCDHLLQITVSCCARSQSSFISWLRYFFFLPQDCVMGFYLIYLPISTPHTHTHSCIKVHHHHNYVNHKCMIHSWQMQTERWWSVQAQWFCTKSDIFTFVLINKASTYDTFRVSFKKSHRKSWQERMVCLQCALFFVCAEAEHNPYRKTISYYAIRISPSCFTLAGFLSKTKTRAES